MRFRVELRKEVVFFVRHVCSASERRAFSEAFEKVREAPIESSEAIVDPRYSRYVLRYFRFAGCIALFELRPLKNLLIVRSCRRLLQRLPRSF